MRSYVVSLHEKSSNRQTRGRKDAKQLGCRPRRARLGRGDGFLRDTTRCRVLASLGVASARRVRVRGGRSARASERVAAHRRVHWCRLDVVDVRHWGDGQLSRVRRGCGSVGVVHVRSSCLRNQWRRCVRSVIECWCGCLRRAAAVAVGSWRVGERLRVRRRHVRRQHLRVVYCYRLQRSTDSCSRHVRISREHYSGDDRKKSSGEGLHGVREQRCWWAAGALGGRLWSALDEIGCLSLQRMKVRAAAWRPRKSRSEPCERRACIKRGAFCRNEATSTSGKSTERVILCCEVGTGETIREWLFFPSPNARRQHLDLLKTAGMSIIVSIYLMASDEVRGSLCSLLSLWSLWSLWPATYLRATCLLAALSLLVDLHHSFATDDRVRHDQSYEEEQHDKDVAQLEHSDHQRPKRDTRPKLNETKRDRKCERPQR